MEIEIKPDERIDDLQFKNLKIIQEKNGFCFGIDSVILADFAKNIKKDSEVVDLGTGTGILGILLCAKTKLSEIIGIEIQKEVADMAKRSIELNKLEKKFKIINMDLKEIINKKNNNNEINNLKNNLEKNSFDYVVTNPPYKKINTGKINENEKQLISRHEVAADLNNFIETASYLLKDKGTIFMVHRPDRLVDILEKMRKEKIEPKEIKFVYPKIEKEPNLILIKGIKNARPFLKVDKPIYIYNEDGNYTDEILRIYNKI